MEVRDRRGVGLRRGEQGGVDARRVAEVCAVGGGARRVPRGCGVHDIAGCGVSEMGNGLWWGVTCSCMRRGCWCIVGAMIITMRRRESL